MSGSSKVDVTSTYYHVYFQSPCMSFHTDPEHPDQEMEWHRRWTENAERWIARVTPILEQRFAMLAAQPDPDWPIVAYDERYPLWASYRKPDTPPPWRIAFLGMSGPGISTVVVAFSRMPTDEAAERFKQELIKDMAMPDAQEGMA